MLEKMLKFNPGERVTSEQALADPYFDVYSYPDDEPINQCPFQIESYVDDFMSDVKVIHFLQFLVEFLIFYIFISVVLHTSLP